MKYLMISLIYLTILQISYFWPEFFLWGVIAGLILILTGLILIFKKKHQDFIIKRLVIVICYILASLIYITFIDIKANQQIFMILSWLFFNFILYIYNSVKKDENLFVYSFITVIYILFLSFVVIYKLLIFFDFKIVYLILVAFSWQIILFLHLFSLFFKNLFENLQLSLLLSFILTEFFWALCFWPASYYVMSGLLVVLCYIIMEIIIIINKEKVNFNKFCKPIVFGFIVIFIILFSAEWI